MRSSYLYVIVFIAGAAVLAVEILGTRILGPFYGVSLFLWSALITVTLASLSIGYIVGGRWADKGPTLARLCYVMAGAGCWLLLIPWLKHPVLAIAEPFGLRFAVLVATFILFAPPLTLLGMISPYAIRLRALHLEEVGRTVGDMYAISTIGSVIAALLTGFVLIPNVGVSRLTLGIGVMLLLCALIGLVVQRRARGTVPAALGLLIVGGVGLWAIPVDQPMPNEGLLAVEQSAYAELRVVDLNGRRHLLIDGGTHTIVDPTSWESFFPYAAVMDLMRNFFEEPGKLLLIGLGGGTIVKNFAREGWTVDVVEIDPVVTEIAQHYFGLSPTEGTTYHVDGRQFLLSREGTYDAIIMDAFGSSSIPFHLITHESFGLIATRLAPNGMFAINIESNGWNDLIVRSLVATLHPHFTHVLALPTTASEEDIGNVVLFAANQEFALQQPLQRNIDDLNYGSSMDFQMHRAWDHRFTPNTRDAPILTDDLNPVDLWSEEINLIARKNLHRYFEESGLSW